MKVLLLFALSVFTMSASALQFSGVEVEFADGYGTEDLKKFETKSKIPQNSNKLAEIGVTKIRFTDVQRETRGSWFSASSKYKMYSGFELYFEYETAVDEKLMEENSYRFGDEVIETSELYELIQSGTENTEYVSGSFLANFTMSSLNSKFYQERQKELYRLKRSAFDNVLSKYNCVRTQIQVKHEWGATWPDLSEEAQKEFIDGVKETYCSFHFSAE